MDSLLDKTIEKTKVTLQMLKKVVESLNSAYSEAIERIEGQLPGDTSLAEQTLS